MTDSNEALSYTDDGEKIFVVSISPKKNNEDFCGIYSTKEHKGCIIADGLGSTKGAAHASKQVVDFVINELNKKTEVIDSTYLNNLFSKSENLLSDIKKTKDTSDEYSTTLIAVIDDGVKLTIAYAGNGGVFHIRNNFHECKGNQLFSWGIENYLIPHTVKNEKGKEALYRFITSNNSNISCKPTILTIEKEYNNDIFLICTDGLFSLDQLKIGKNKATGEIVCIYDNIFVNLITSIENATRKSTEFKSMRENICDYINKAKPYLDDDITIGVLIDN